jgi:hypothetical protein
MRDRRILIAGVDGLLTHSLYEGYIEQRLGVSAMINEADRNTYFAAYPTLSNFIATGLQDAQLTENDEACSDEREARDSSTIYTLQDSAFCKCVAIVTRFERECAQAIAEAMELSPEGEGFEYARDYMTAERIGSTLWLAITGSGVGFLDDGNAPCLVRLDQWATEQYCEGFYFDDDGEMYLIA